MRRVRVLFQKVRSGYSTVAIVVLNILILFFFMEGLARAIVYGIMPAHRMLTFKEYSEIPSWKRHFTRHPYLNYTLMPGYRGERSSHNSLGYRGDEFSVAKPNGQFRIVAIGGSTTYSPYVEDGETFSVRLERFLVEGSNCKNIQVINAGVGGYTSWESLINLQFRVLDLNPDMIIVYHAINDVQSRFVTPSAYRGDNSGYRKPFETPELKWWENSVALRVSRLLLAPRIGLPELVGADHALNFFDPESPSYSKEDPFEILAKNRPIFFERNLRNMAAVAKEYGVVVMLATWSYSPEKKEYFASLPHYRKAIREHNEVIEQVARRHGLPLYDFARIMPHDPKYWDDGIHLTAEGTLLKARLFSEFVLGRGLIPGDCTTTN